MERKMWDAYAKQAGGVTFDGKPLPTWDELGNDRQACWVAAAKVAADEIERLRQQNAELVNALKHCINALSEFEKDSKLPTEQFQYNIVYKLSGFLLGALDNAKKATGGE
jgi:molecular chaperone GrpE (heat shock protein)